MFKKKAYEFWFVTGSQHLYGQETLNQVNAHSQQIAEALDKSPEISYKIVFKPVVKTPEEIRQICVAASTDPNCAGIITWMHTFSPAKMWIWGLSELRKPLLHLHTQFNRDIPWDSIDMDFMNLNQSAHGDREYGYIGARMRMPKKVVVGHWQDPEVSQKIGEWMNVAAAFIESKSLKIARFGDNMREVAVTEGDKVEAEIKFGWAVSAYAIADLVARVDAVSENQINELIDEYESLYDFAEDTKKGAAKHESVRYQARIEAGLRAFLEDGGFDGFTTNFEVLHGMKQLPGLAVQRLTADGFGFGAEGDWKTAALVRTMKIMADNKNTALMEDYTYNFEPGNELILGAHMLEVCPSLAATKPKIEVHPLGIGGKADPARLTFDGKAGHGLCASLIDMGNRFRLIINEVNAVKQEKPMPKLPVGRVLWQPEPSLKESAEAWILAGGAHHTSFSLNVSPTQLFDWAELTGIECVIINKDTNLLNFRNELKWNEIFWKLK